MPNNIPIFKNRSELNLRVTNYETFGRLREITPGQGGRTLYQEEVAWVNAEAQRLNINQEEYVVAGYEDGSTGRGGAFLQPVKFRAEDVRLRRPTAQELLEELGNYR